MKKPLALLAAVCLATPLIAADGSPASGDPFAGAFIPPEVIVLAGDQVGLSKEQRDSVRAKVDAARMRGDELAGQLSRQMIQLSALAKAPRIDEPALLAQLDQVLNTERELKRLKVSTMASIKNTLTPEQQAKLIEVTKGNASAFADALKERLTAKVDRVKQAAQKLAAGGRDPAALAAAMDQKVRPLLDSGHPLEAEAALDQILADLEKEQGK